MNIMLRSARSIVLGSVLAACGGSEPAPMPPPPPPPVAPAAPVAAATTSAPAIDSACPIVSRGSHGTADGVTLADGRKVAWKSGGHGMVLGLRPNGVVEFYASEFWDSKWDNCRRTGLFQEFGVDPTTCEQGERVDEKRTGFWFRYVGEKYCKPSPSGMSTASRYDSRTIAVYVDGAEVTDPAQMSAFAREADARPSGAFSKIVQKEAVEALARQLGGLTGPLGDVLAQHLFADAAPTVETYDVCRTKCGSGDLGACYCQAKLDAGKFAIYEIDPATGEKVMEGNEFKRAAWDKNEPRADRNQREARGKTVLVDLCEKRNYPQACLSAAMLVDEETETSAWARRMNRACNAHVEGSCEKLKWQLDAETRVCSVQAAACARQKAIEKETNLAGDATPVGSRCANTLSHPFRAGNFLFNCDEESGKACFLARMGPGTTHTEAALNAAASQCCCRIMD
jgi:hypothetical protein